MADDDIFKNWKIEFDKRVIEEYGSHENYEKAMKIEYNKRKREKYISEYNRFFELSEIPVKFYRSSVKLCNRDIFNKVKENKFTILKGGLGVGKTSLAVAYSKYYLKTMLRCDKDKKSEYVYCNGYPFFVRSYEYELMDINDMKKAVEFLYNKSLLIIDDIGFIKSNDFLKRLFAALILYRMDNRLETIITINESIKNVFDDRICDKIMEEFNLIEFNNPNRREKKKPLKL